MAFNEMQLQSTVHTFIKQNDNDEQLEAVDEVDDAQLIFLAEAIATIERMEEVARANAKRLNDAIAALEMELSLTEPPVDSEWIDSPNATHFSEFPTDEALGVE